MTSRLFIETVGWFDAGRQTQTKAPVIEKLNVIPKDRHSPASFEPGPNGFFREQIVDTGGCPVAPCLLKQSGCPALLTGKRGANGTKHYPGGCITDPCTSVDERAYTRRIGCCQMGLHRHFIEARRVISAIDL